MEKLPVRTGKASMNASEIETIIQEAFKDVKLNAGTSLLQAKVMDSWGVGINDKEFYALPQFEITDDWTRLTLETLDQYPFLSFMDAEGFRYYIPAFMRSVLISYEPSNMRVIGTLSSFSPRIELEGQWEHSMLKYSSLDRKQCIAIARFLQYLPDIIELDEEDQTVVERAIRNYWHKYL